MQAKVFLLAVVTVLFTCTVAYAQVEEITLSTYYPAPYGEYDEMAAENLFADKVIIGNMDVNGDGIESDSADIAAMNVGSLLVENNVGIGTTSPQAPLHSYTNGYEVARFQGLDAWGCEVSLINADGKDWRVGNQRAPGGFVIDEQGVATRVFIENNTGNVGIGTTNPNTLSAGLGWDSPARFHAHGGNQTNIFSNPSNIVDLYLVSSTGAVDQKAALMRLSSSPYLYQIGGLTDAIGAWQPGSPILNLDLANGNVGIGTATPDASYKVDVNGRIKGGGTAEAWSANRTSYLNATSGGPWTTIPGLSITFTLSRDALVQFSATGTQRVDASLSPANIHCQYRFVVDGTPRGHPTYGQCIHVSQRGASWWNTWSFSDFANLSSGSHTIEVQACNGTTGYTAVICGEVPPNQYQDYCHGNLNILAVYN